MVGSTPDYIPRGARLTSALQLWILNIVFGALVALGYLQHAPEDLSAKGILFLALGLISSISLLSVPIGALGIGLALLHAGHPRRWATRQGLLWTVALLLIFADTRVFGVFRFHLNGVVWNSLVTPGSGDAIHPGVVDFLLPIFAFVGIVTTQAFLYSKFLSRARQRHGSSARLQPLLLSLGLLIPIVAAERNLYARDVEQGNAELVTLSELLPYYTLPQKIWRVLSDEPLTESEAVFQTDGLTLNYPKEAIELPTEGLRPNILVLVLDGLRADMLGSETMPNTWDLSQDARVFNSHWSGGNCTRHGIFTLMYGLHGNYWGPILEKKTPPVLLETLGELNYETKILCSASQFFPEFRSTAWSGIQDTVEDAFEGEPWQKDRLVASRFGEWLDERENLDRPFFAFSLLDSTHANYSFPLGDTYFKPSSEKVGYIHLSYGLKPPDRWALFNRYRNSVRHGDAVVGNMVQSLRERGLLENTIILVTGDHGEEFFENGFWGHHSNFSQEQVAVPFVLRGPGISPGTENRPTSHIDLPRTLMELLGVSPEMAPRYTLGENLLKLPADRQVVSSSWSSLAMQISETDTMVLSAYSDDIPIRAYGRGWQPLKDENAVLRENTADLRKLLDQCQEFLT